MTDSTLQALRDPDLVAARDHHFARLEALFAGDELDETFVLCGLGLSCWDPGPAAESWLDEALAEAAKHVEAAKDWRVFRPLTVTYDPRGVHFVDHLFGAHCFLLGDDGFSWQAHTLDTPIGELQPPDLDANEQWQRARRIAEGFVKRHVPGVLFGMPTLSSALNIAINLYGQEIIVAMMTAPEAAAHDLRVINDTILELHYWYLENVPGIQRQCIVPASRCQPPGHGQLCGCSTQLLSPRLYRDFIAPLDEEILALHPHGGMIHLCGAHAYHIPVWRKMASLRAVQTNDRASEDAAAYFAELRDDQILYVNPCDEMPVERIMEITGGRRLVLPANLPEPPRATR